jgi:SSS family transporter
MNLTLLGILGYVLIQLGIGIAISRRISTEEDYLLAGRSLGYGLATLSIFATWFGAETCIGAAGEVYSGGLSASTADPFGYSLCLFLMALIAIPLWKRGITTLADLFRQRYGISVERVAALILAPSSLIWAAAQIRAFGQIIAASSTLPVETAIIIAATVIILYTVLGGMLADAITDFIQGGILIVGIISLFVLVMSNLPDGESFFTLVPSERLSLYNAEQSWLARIESWAVPVFGSLVAQELIARVLSSRSAKVAQRSAFMASGLYFSIGILPVMIGLVGYIFIPSLQDTEQILPLMAQKFFPPFLYILFAGALVSAILSTVDSALLAAASLTAHNIVVSMRPDFSEKQKVITARSFVVIFGLCAFIMALYAEGIYGLVEEASAFGSSGLFVIMIFALFTKFGGAKTAMATVLVGGITWGIGSHVLHTDYGFTFSLGAALLTYVIVGLLESPQSEAINLSQRD